MGILRHLQHWLTGRGPQLLTAEFVPETHTIRLWADTFPWETLVQAVEQSFARRFPKKRPQGGRPLGSGHLSTEDTKIRSSYTVPTTIPPEWRREQA
jgi:hypothetical protein